MAEELPEDSMSVHFEALREMSHTLFLLVFSLLLTVAFTVFILLQFTHTVSASEDCLKNENKPALPLAHPTLVERRNL